MTSTTATAARTTVTWDEVTAASAAVDAAAAAYDAAPSDAASLTWETARDALNDTARAYRNR